MSRHVIAFEGKPSVLPDTWLDKGSLYISPQQKYLPVTRGFHWEGTPIGRARDLMRNEETGEVSVEIEFQPGYEPSKEEDEQYDYTFMATHLVVEEVPATEDRPAYRLYKEAQLRQIARVPNAANYRVSQDLQGL